MDRYSVAPAFLEMTKAGSALPTVSVRPSLTFANSFPQALAEMAKSHGVQNGRRTVFSAVSSLGQQTSLKTSDKLEAHGILQARNESKAQPRFNPSLARVYCRWLIPVRFRFNANHFSTATVQFQVQQRTRLQVLLLNDQMIGIWISFGIRPSFNLIFARRQEA